MRLKALKRPNPYIEEGIQHKPKQSTSPYEMTLERLLKSKHSPESIKPLELKFCKHCSFSIKLSSNGSFSSNDSYPQASLICSFCSSEICSKCSRTCERCQHIICFVCSFTIFEENSTLDVCPDCK